MSLPRDTVEIVDARPLVPGNLEIIHRFKDLEKFPVVEIDIPKLLKLVNNHPEADIIEPFGIWEDGVWEACLSRAERLVGHPVAMPWVTLGTCDPHCFTNGMDPLVVPDSKPASELDLLWPHRDRVFALIRGGMDVLSILQTLGHRTIRVHVPYQQKSMLENLCGVAGELVGIFPSKAENERFQPCPVIQLGQHSQ